MIEKKNHFYAKKLMNLECALRSALCGVRSAECALRSALCGVRSAECALCVSARKQSLQGKLCTLLSESVYIDGFAASIHTEDVLQNNAFSTENNKVFGSEP